MVKHLKRNQPLEQRALCPECGYDLRGTNSERCSECGQQIDWEEALRHGRLGQMTPLQEWAAWCAKVFGLFLFIFLISQLFGLTTINSVLDRIKPRWYLIPIVMSPLHIVLAILANALSSGRSTAAAVTSVALSCAGCLLLGAYIALSLLY